MPAGEIAGFVSVCVSVLFFGTCFVPVKQYDTGDGLYFQVSPPGTDNTGQNMGPVGKHLQGAFGEAKGGGREGL